MDIQYFVMTPRTSVIEVDMDNYTILQLISNHFTETFFFIYEIHISLIIESTINLVYFN